MMFAEGHVVDKGKEEEAAETINLRDSRKESARHDSGSSL